MIKPRIPSIAILAQSDIYKDDGESEREREIEIEIERQKEKREKIETNNHIHKPLKYFDHMKLPLRHQDITNYGYKSPLCNDKFV